MKAKPKTKKSSTTKTKTTRGKKKVTTTETKKAERVLVLRTCAPDMSSYHTPSFIWPKSGFAEAPDWDPNPAEACGHGLHGLLWGNGDWSLLSNKPDAVWMIVAVDPADGLVINPSKCRYRRGEVIYSGEMQGALTRILCSPEALSRALAEAKESDRASGHSSTAASSGNSSTAASSGYSSTAASSGDSSTAASSGDSSKAASSGYYSKAASSGDYSTAASSGYYSKAASSGDSSKAASSGDYSKAASSGDSGIAAAIGHGTQAKAGELGLLIVTYWDEPAKRFRALVGEVGIDGIKADTFYTAKDGKLFEVAP